MPLDALIADPTALAAVLAGMILLFGLALIPVVAIARPGGRSSLRARVQAVAKTGGVRSTTSAASSKAKKLLNNNLKELAGPPPTARRVRIRQLIRHAGLSWTMTTFYLFSAASGVASMVGCVVGGLPLWVMPFAAIVGFLGLPRFLLKHLASKRQRKFTTQLADSIDIIVRGIRSGLPVGECLNIIARESPDPIGEEFKMLIEGQKLGMTMKETLDKAIERMPTADMRFFAVVLVLQQKTGGNLAEALANLSGILRARKKMADKIRTMSAEARMTASIIGALPFLLSLTIYFLNPSYIELLFTDPLGKKMSIGGGLWMLIGVFVMKKMISFKI
jgi:tight adherence protein B